MRMVKKMASSHPLWNLTWRGDPLERSQVVLQAPAPAMMIETWMRTESQKVVRKGGREGELMRRVLDLLYTF